MNLEMFLVRQRTYRKVAGWALRVFLLVLTANPRAQADGDLPSNPAQSRRSLPNILFMILDDVGVDQMKLYGYGGSSQPNLPNISAVAAQGILFRDAWAMPDCSPSRATFWEGRYPFRTNILNPIQPPDLANSQVSPDEVTVPEILRKKGYVSGLIGKMHLSGSSLAPANNPLGNQVYRALGFDYFEGYLEGAPLSIDTTAGGVAAPGTYSCGFVPSRQENPVTGADEGACYQASGACSILSTSTGKTPGRTCMESGGILDPIQPAVCQAVAPANLLFSNQNGYYTANWVINRSDGSTLTQPPEVAAGRGYRSILEADRAIAWINQQQKTDKPWMATIGFSSAHSPWHNVPSALLPADALDTGAFSCGIVGNPGEESPGFNIEVATTRANQRVLMQQMQQGVDHEIGRVLVETGLATRDNTGNLQYRPEATNTLVVIIGDNGSYLTVVNAPFDPSRAKGTPYQTGVWVPLIISGPMVKSPGREVPHMVNGLDLFQLFAEVAGIDPLDVVPQSHPVDAKSMLPYLTNPNKSSIRRINFAQTGENFRANTGLKSPCISEAIQECTSFFPTAQLCTKNSGIWYGLNGAAGPEGLPDCCAVNAYRQAQTPAQTQLTLAPILSTAARNTHYKLVQNETKSCTGGGSDITDEFYQIDQAVPNPKLDLKTENLLAKGTVGLTPKEKRNYRELRGEILALTASKVPCPGDGNLDLRVDEKDIQGWTKFSNQGTGKSSWYDFNLDGRTDEADLTIIDKNMGTACGKQ